MDDTKTIWRCPVCHKDGMVEHVATENVVSVLTHVVRQHEVTSPFCTIEFNRLQIKWSDD